MSESVSSKAVSSGVPRPKPAPAWLIFAAMVAMAIATILLVVFAQ